MAKDLICGMDIQAKGCFAKFLEKLAKDNNDPF
jgi:hypothetical protein